MVDRKTEKSGFRRSVHNLRSLMREIRHYSLEEQSEKINQLFCGHYAYYGVAGNSESLLKICCFTERYWRRMLSSRSQKSYVTWGRFRFVKTIFALQRPKIFVPYMRMKALAVLLSKF